MNIDAGTVVAGCAAFSAIGGVGGWIAKHFIRDVANEQTLANRTGDDERTRRRRSDEGEGARLRRVDEDSQPARGAVTAADLEAALARHEIRLLEKFNGRYPTKEVFSQCMENVRDTIAETRKYIGDAKRELSAKIDERIGGLEVRIHDVERKP